MRTGKSTNARTQRSPLAAAATARSSRFSTLLLAALLALTLTLAPRAEAFVYWTDQGAGMIGRANLDGTGVDRLFVACAGSQEGPFGVAVDASHIYWATGEGIGRANLDGTRVDHGFIAGAEVPRGVAVDAAHVYWANEDTGTIGRANLDGTGVDQDFIPGEKALFLGFPYDVAVDALRSFSFGKVKRNKKQGTAKLMVRVPGPGTLKLANTRAVKEAEERAEAKGKEKLPMRAKAETKKTLNRKGKVKVEAEVTYTPQGGNPTIVGNTDTKTVKLIKR